ncbi:phytoene/squalene synthase family protein [Zafaria sp. J156]|uniref:phytoene/squalene synthase family protein n=1 Tax=Zafaria sp. J156 TaxID=3116490 RepID=UPI002E77BC10|nr:phytoene/squalene synthase family protein [Zafaria sp. J156]MEE1620945.1 phytoene/squalene synthase family protein [Zafaria sp. J156]
MRPTPLGLYTRTAAHGSGMVLEAYSTSFSLACRLLGRRTRAHIANVYALVRLADEVVDGVAAEAGLPPERIAAALDGLEEETEAALACGYSTNLVVHAFAATARAHGIGPELTRPFFASMRADVHARSYTAAELGSYIYGSAEVVGLLCLRVFSAMPGTAPGHDAELEASARALGAAFQKVNFLRDLAADSAGLGRSYLPGTAGGTLSEARKAELVAEIRADLDAARSGISYLDHRAARAVQLAHRLFGRLLLQLERTPAAGIAARRVRVGPVRKAAIAASVLAVPLPGRAPSRAPRPGRPEPEGRPEPVPRPGRAA